MNNLALVFQSLTIILAPLYILRADIDLPFINFSIPTTLLEVVLITTVIITVLEFIKEKASISLLKTKIDIFVLLFLFSMVLTLFKSYQLVSGLGILKAYFIEPILFFYCLVYQSRKNGVNDILNSLIISGVWLSLLSLLQKVTGGFTLAPYELAQGRVSAVYNSANSLALYLGPIIILTVTYNLTSKRNIKLPLSLVTLFLAITLIWTRSRGGIVALLGAFLIFGYTLFCLKVSILKRYWYILPMIVLIITSVFLYSFYRETNFIPYTGIKPYTQGDTLQIRYFIWIGTINMLKDSPIFGAGLNNFKTLYTNQYRLPQYQEEFQYPHNIFLTFWAETGILGLTTFIILVVENISLILRNFAKNQAVFLGAAFLAIFGYWILHGMVDVPYFKNDLSLEFWTVLALLQIWLEAKRRSNLLSN